MRLGKLGKQTVLISKRAFSSIRFIESEKIEWEEYHFRARKRETEANDYFNKVISPKENQNETYVRDVLKDIQKEEEDEACL